MADDRLEKDLMVYVAQALLAKQTSPHRWDYTVWKGMSKEDADKAIEEAAALAVHNTGNLGVRVDALTKIIAVLLIERERDHHP